LRCLASPLSVEQVTREARPTQVRTTVDRLDQMGQNGDVPLTVSAADAKSGLSDLLRRAEAGEEIVVTRNGEPVARIGPLRNRIGGFARGEVVVHDEHWWHADDDLAEEFDA
jgi:prevent-host-death family protein